MIKKLARTSLVLLLLGVTSPTSAFGKAKYSYEGKVDGRIAQHTGSPGGLASERLDLRFQQNAIFSKRWKGAFGFSAWNDLDGDIPGDDARDLRPRNFFINYRGQNLDLTLGYQQVIWGEALGMSYSDIVNPRDLRDGGFGDPADVRLQTPMINTRWISDRFTAQLLYIPQPYFHLLPLPGNDYSFPYQKFLPGTSVAIRRQEQLPLSTDNAEYGGRLGTMIGSWDFSVFALSNYDRNPTYYVDPSSTPGRIVVREDHSRVRNYGITLTNDFDGYLMRAEAVMTNGRKFPTLNGTTLASVERNNIALVIGLDFPTWKSINSTLQLSHDSIEGAAVSGLLRTKDQSLLMIRLARTVFFEHEIEFIESYSLSDSGSKTQLNYMLPISKTSELRLGGEILAGPLESDFGKREAASRVFAQIRWHFQNQ